MTTVSVVDLEREFGLDGSGLSTSCKQNYEADRAKNQIHKGYEKIVVMVGLKYRLVSAFKFADESICHDLPYFVFLLNETVKRYSRVDLVCGDSGFLSGANCDLVVGVGGVSRFYPKRGCCLRLKGSKAWRVVFEGVVADLQLWFEDYLGVLMWRVVFRF